MDFLDLLILYNQNDGIRAKKQNAAESRRAGMFAVVTDYYRPYR